MKQFRWLWVGLMLIASVHSRAQETHIVSGLTNDAPIRYSTVPEKKPTYDEGEIVTAVEHRRIFNGDYDYMTEITLSAYGFVDEDNQNEVGIFSGLGWFELKPGSHADSLIHQPIILELGVLGRHYFTPPHVFIQPYIGVSCNWAEMAWSYRNPMWNGTEYIYQDDTSLVIDANASAGVALKFSPQIKLFGEIDGGGTAIPCETCKGIRNDFLKSFYYVGVKAGFSIAF